MPTHNIRGILTFALLFVLTGLVVGWYTSEHLINVIRPDLDWNPAYESIQGGLPNYEDTELHYPPWAILFPAPLGVFPSEFAWGIYIYLVFAFVIFSIPQNPSRNFIVDTLLLAFAYPTLRTIADGNLEVFVALGVLLIARSYPHQNPWLMSLGVLMATLKPQSLVFVIPMLVIYMLVTWQPKRWLLAGALTLTVVGVTLLIYGMTWLERAMDISDYGNVFYMNSSISGSLLRLDMWGGFSNALRGFVILTTIWVLYQTRFHGTREKFGMLIAAGLLIAPYAAGNNAFSIVAIGIIPLYQNYPKMGIPLLVMLYLPYLTIGATAFRFQYEPYYWTLFFVLSWGLLLWACLRHAHESAKSIGSFSRQQPPRKRDNPPHPTA